MEVTMKYFTYVINFIQQYDYFILPAISCALLLFCVVNFCKNVYSKQNRKITAVTRKICAYPHKAEQYSNGLPQEYRRQWRAFVNSEAKYPSLVFEFAPIKYRARLIRLIVLAAIVNSLYLVVFIADVTRYAYLIMQVVFWLAFALVMVADKLIFAAHERKAKKIFARLVNELNRACPQEQKREEVFDDTVKQLRDLQKCVPTNDVFARASELLRNKGLDNDRTASEQRKLNGALNGLLQSYTKTHA